MFPRPDSFRLASPPGYHRGFRPRRLAFDARATPDTTDRGDRVQNKFGQNDSWDRSTISSVVMRVRTGRIVEKSRWRLFDQPRWGRQLWRRAGLQTGFYGSIMRRRPESRLAARTGGPTGSVKQSASPRGSLETRRGLNCASLGARKNGARRAPRRPRRM